MPAPYSYDLRGKVIAAVKRGERKSDVSRMFNISRNTLDLWLKREEQTGECQAITEYQQGNRHKITDWQRFREFAQKHGDKTQGEMASLWGDNVTQQNISDALRKIGLSRKKRRMAIENEMNSSVRSFRSD
jgi:transposase